MEEVWCGLGLPSITLSVISLLAQDHGNGDERRTVVTEPIEGDAN